MFLRHNTKLWHWIWVYWALILVTYHTNHIDIGNNYKNNQISFMKELPPLIPLELNWGKVSVLSAVFYISTQRTSAERSSSILCQLKSIVKPRQHHAWCLFYFTQILISNLFIIQKWNWHYLHIYLDSTRTLVVQINCLSH